MSFKIALILIATSFHYQNSFAETELYPLQYTSCNMSSFVGEYAIRLRSCDPDPSRNEMTDYVAPSRVVVSVSTKEKEGTFSYFYANGKSTVHTFEISGNSNQNSDCKISNEVPNVGIVVHGIRISSSGDVEAYDQLVREKNSLICVYKLKKL